MTDLSDCFNAGNVYSMTNSAANNEVIAFRKANDGTLSYLGLYNTGGSGTGEQIVDPLVSQHSVVLRQDGRMLFVVNAGSNTISSFSVRNSGRLALCDQKPSGGVRPNSIAVHHDLLYVANAGNAATGTASNISGFCVCEHGELVPIKGAVYPLSTANAQPSSVVFSSHGERLFVSELNTNRISVFLVSHNGTLSDLVVNNSSGAGPFGSTYLSRGFLLVSEVGANALSSYRPDHGGSLEIISGSIPDYQTGTCWVSVTRDEYFAFTSNAGSHTLTSYFVENGGMLSVQSIVYSTMNGNGAPIDSAVSRRINGLYVLNGNEGSISVFRVCRDGKLDRVQVFEDTGLPILGAQGMAAD